MGVVSKVLSPSPEMDGVGGSALVPVGDRLVGHEHGKRGGWWVRVVSVASVGIYVCELS